MKNADTIRVDVELERETANHWRFRHPYFQRGKPELLSKMRRTNGSGVRERQQQQSAAAVAAGGGAAVGVLPDQVGSGCAVPTSTIGGAAVIGVGAKPAASEEEVQTLKKKIEEMTKNIGALTAMVEKVSLKQEEQGTAAKPPAAEEGADDEEETRNGNNNKRKKLADPPLPEAAVLDAAAVRPDAMPSSSSMMMDLDGMGTALDATASLPDAVGSSSAMMMVDVPVPMPMAPPPIPAAAPLMKRGDLSLSPPSEGTRSTTAPSDGSNDFVDDLFAAFQDGGDGGSGDALFADAQSIIGVSEDSSFKADGGDGGSNRPDPELMRRLGDALMLLPKEIQELIVNRLIDAITSTDFVPPAVAACDGDKKPAAASAAVAAVVESAPQSPSADRKATALPLPAATLAALLHHYSAQVQKQHHDEEEERDGAKDHHHHQKNVLKKTIPVIPVHA